MAMGINLAADRLSSTAGRLFLNRLSSLVPFRTPPENLTPGFPNALGWCGVLKEPLGSAPEGAMEHPSSRRTLVEEAMTRQLDMQKQLQLQLQV